MRTVIAVSILLLVYEASAVPAHWNGVRLSNEWYSSYEAMEYHLGSDISGENEGYAWMHSYIYGHVENGNLLIKHFDFSRESMDPTFNWWALAVYGDIVSEANFNSLNRIEDFYSNDLRTGGTLVENPSDFYMAFRVSEVLLESGNYAEGRSWYGWVHVSIDENLEMTLLGEGINLSGGAVTVGAVPEPSSGLLLLAGGALLALRRRRRSFKRDARTPGGIRGAAYVVRTDVLPDM